MRATLLGPVSARVGDTELSLGGFKQRAVFALLALNAGHVVPLDRLVEELWSDEPPARATLVLQSYVSRLRRVLANAREGGGPVPAIESRPPGWLLTLAPEHVDATRFAALVGRARGLLASGDPDDAACAAENLGTGLDLWVGEALTDLVSFPFAREEAARLHDLRLSAIELRLEAMLALGEADTVAHEARSFVTASPLRERAWCALMLGLYRAGRQAEALAAAAQLRRTLADELGLDPSPEVRALEERILRQDPALRSAARPAVPPQRPQRLEQQHSREATAAVGRDLLGREEALALVQEAVAAAAEGHGRLLVLSAPAGLGKSSILRALGELVTSTGGAVVTGGGVGGGTMPALWPWVSIVRGLTPHDGVGQDGGHPPAGDLAAAAEALLGGADRLAGSDAVGASGLGRTSLYRGVIDLLAHRRAAGPLAVLVDDAQWVDSDTLTLLSLAVDELVRAGVLFAVAFRSDEPSIADVQGMVDRIPRELVTRIDLRGLVPPEVAEVMRRVSGAKADPHVAAALQARTGGHPLFVTELVRLLTSEHRLDADGVATALPRQIRDVLRRRLERLPGQTVALLTVVAVAGGRADVDLLALVTGMDPDAVVDGCEPALLAGLLIEDPAIPDGFTLSHDLVRQALAESVSAARRVRLHAKIAAALQARGALTPQQVVDLAHHLSLAAPVVGPAAAIPYLVTAAEDALSRFANDQAEQSLRAALDLARQVPDPAERVALERQMEGRLAIFLAYTRGSVLPARPDAAPQAPPPTDPESAAGWLGTAIMTGVSGDYPATVRLAEQALAVQLVPVASAAAHYALAFGHFMSGRVDVARREYAAVEGLLSALGSDLPGLLASLAVSVATYSAMAAHMQGDEAAADGWMTTAAARGTTSDVAAINVALGRCWLAGMRGDVEEARVAATTCGGFAERMDYPLFALQARIVSGWADALAGDTAGAERADLARQEYAATGVRLFLPFHLLLCAEARAATGDTATAARLVTQSRVVSAECGDVCRSPRLLSFADGLVPAS